MPGHRLRSAAGNAMLVIATAAVCFLVAEVAARLTYHPENLHTVIRFDPHLGWSLSPGRVLHSVDDVRELDYTIRVNSLGMRDREIERGKPEGVRRVAFLGDSFAFGIGVEQDRRLSDVVGRALGEDFEVINAAVCGWGTDQELIHYRRVVRDLHPDIVVLTMCVSNDVLNNMLDHVYLGGTPKPRFVLRDSLELVDGVIEPPEVALRHRIRNTVRRSRFLLFVKRRLDQLIDHPTGVAPVDPGNSGYRPVDRLSHSHYSIFERDYDEDFERAWLVTEELIRELDRECRRDGADLLVLAFPLQIEVDDAWRERVLAEAGIDPASLDLERPFERLERLCRGIGVPFIHPLREFRSASHRPLYFEKDTHPNAYGHGIAAAAVLDVMRHRYGLDVHVAAQDQDFVDRF